MSAVLTGEQAAQRVLPLGSTDSDGVVQAVGGISELVRRLNHATRHRQALPWPSSVYSVLGSLREASAGLQQLCEHIAARLLDFAEADNVYDDRSREDGWSEAHDQGLNVAAFASERLADAASVGKDLAAVFGQAQDLVSPLALRMPDEVWQ